MNTEILLSTVLAGSTVAYTVINLMIWYESKATRRQKTTPMVIAYLSRTENQCVGLNFKNIGQGLAKNVRVRPVKDYHPFGKEKLTLSAFGIVRNGFNNFPPQYEISYILNSTKLMKKENAKDYIEIEIMYENSTRKKFSEVFKLPLNQVTGFIRSDPPDTFMEQIPYYLKKINESLKEIKTKSSTD